MAASTVKSDPTMPQTKDKDPATDFLTNAIRQLGAGHVSISIPSSALDEPAGMSKLEPENHERPPQETFAVGSVESLENSEPRRNKPRRLMVGSNGHCVEIDNVQHPSTSPCNLRQETGSKTEEDIPLIAAPPASPSPGRIPAWLNLLLSATLSAIHSLQKSPWYKACKKLITDRHTRPTPITDVRELKAGHAVSFSRLCGLCHPWAMVEEVTDTHVIFIEYQSVLSYVKAKIDRRQIETSKFLEGNRVKKLNIEPADHLSREEIVKRAQDRLGETSYNVFRWNCQHFVLSCYGHKEEAALVECAFGFVQVVFLAIVGVSVYTIVHMLKNL